MAKIHPSVLEDFIVTTSNHPDYDDNKLMELFPEFDNEKSLLDAAFAYKATKAEKGYDEKTLYSKFPEFFGVAPTDNRETTERQPTRQAQEQRSVGATSAKPDRITSAFGGMSDPLYSGQYQYHQQVADKEAQMQREQAAQLPLSQQDIDRQAEIDRLRQEQFQTNFERAQRGEGYSLFPTDNQAAIDALERQKPDYLRGKAKTPQEVYDQTMGAWTANTQEGQKAKAQADRDTEAVLGNIKQQFDADVDSYAAGLQKQFDAEPQVKTVAERMNQQFVSTEFKQLQNRVKRGELSVADAQSQADAIWKEKYAPQIQSSAEALWKEKYVPQIQSYADKLWNDTYQKMYSNEASTIQNSLFRQMTDANGDYISQQLRRLGQEEVDRSTQSLSTTIAKDIVQLEKERSEAISRASARGQSRFGAYGAIGGQMSANTAYPREKDEQLALLKQAQQFLDDARKMSTGAKQSGQGFWRDLGKGFGANIGDVDTWDMGMSQLVRSANLKKIVEKYEKDKNSLTDEEKALMDAAVTYMASSAYNSDKLSRGYKAGQTTAESIPFMLQFLIMPVNAMKDKVAKGILGYGIDQFGGKAAQAAGRKYGLGTALKETGTLLAGNMAAAGMQTAAFGGAKIVEGTISRMTGEIQPDFDEQGHLIYGGRKYMQNFANAAWNATVDTYVENLSEMILTSGDPIKALVRGSEWFGKTIGKSQIARFIADVRKTPFAQVAERMQFRDYPEEVAEEYVGGLLKWGASTDIHSAKEAGLDVDSQIDIWLGLAPTSIAFAGLGVGGYAVQGGINRWQNSQAAANLRKIMEEGEERKYLENLLTSQNSEAFAEASHDVVKSILRNDKIDDETKRFLLDGIYTAYQSQVAQEAEQAQQAEEQQEAEVQQDRQTQLRQRAQQAAQEAVQGMAHEDGTIYRVAVKGLDGAVGYASAGNLDIQTEDNGTLSTRGKDLITVKFDDGHTEQYNASELTVLEAPQAAQDRIDQMADHFFAQYANEDLFHVGDKVYLQENGQRIVEESSNITAIDDAGIHVEAYDEQTGQTGEMVIPHEQAAEKLALAQDKQPAQEQVVNFTIDGNPLQLYQVGEDTYEERTPDGKTYRYSSADLAEMGAQRVDTNEGGTLDEVKSPTLDEVKPPYPTDKTGNPAWDKMEVPQSAQVLFDLFKGNRESAKAYADDQLKEAEKVQKAAAKQKSHNLNISKRLEEDKTNERNKNLAAAAVKYWQDVKLALAQIKTAEEIVAEQAQREAMMAAREQRSKTEAGTQANLAPQERYAAAPKYYGHEITITTPTGQELKARYVLHDAFALTPSHNPFDNFNSSEGYPTNADGQNVNDRNYKDPEEIEKVMQIANAPDGRLWTNMPIQQGGLIASHNGSQQGLQVGYRNGKAEKYRQAVANNIATTGIDAAHVSEFEYPEVSLELVEPFEFSTSNLAMFNAQETQKQSNTAMAAKFTRALTPQAISEIGRVLEPFETIDAFFANDTATNDLINKMIETGVLTQRDRASLFDNDKISATGKDILKNVFLGSVLDADTINLLGDDEQLKGSILRAIPQIIENSGLEEYALTEDINNAIRALYDMRAKGLSYYEYTRQLDMETGLPASADYQRYALWLAEAMETGGVSNFRNRLGDFNRRAKSLQGGQLDVFGSDVRTLDELKEQQLQEYGFNYQEPATPAAEQLGADEQGGAASNAQVQSPAPNNENVAPQEQPTETQTEEQVFDADELRNQSAEAKQQLTQEPQATPQNTIFTEEEAERVRARMRARRNRLNMGIDPEQFADGVFMAGYYMEKGVRKFADFARAMLNEFGEWVRPYLKQWYMGLRYDPRAVGADFVKDMDDITTVDTFDINNFDANTADNGTEIVQSTINEENNVNNSPENLQESEKNTTFAGENNNDNGNTEENSGRVQETQSGVPESNRLQQGGLASGETAPRADAHSLGESLAGKSSDEQHQLAHQWAENNGVLFNIFDLVKKNNWLPFKGGNENDNWVDTKQGVIYKMNNLMNSAGKISDLFERVELYNQLFADTPLAFYGFSTLGSGIVYPIYTQHFIPDGRTATVEEINDYMRSRGFEPTGKKDGEFTNGEFIVSDAKPRNVLVAPNGAVYVIDADVKRAGQGGGGKKATFEKGQKISYHGHDGVIEDVNSDGTYNISVPNGLGIPVTAFNIPEKDLKAKEQKPVQEVQESPMMAQFRSIKEQYPDATLMFRVGDFYELYEDDAVEASKILGITLTKRQDGRAFAGLPFHALDIYLPKLVRAGKRVAICNQLEDPKITKKLAKRGVSELETPGTPNQEPAQVQQQTEEQSEQEPVAQVVTDTVGEITESKHTKTGATIYVVKPMERVSDAEFRTLRRRAKENNGYYSTFVRGYVFNSVNDATRFNNISDVQTTTKQTSADSETAIRTGETTEAEAASVGRDRGDQSRAEGEQRGEVSPASVGAVGTVTPQEEQPVLSQEEADAAVTERQEAISKIDAATEQIENQLDKLEASDETTEEQPAQPTDSPLDVLEYAKQRRAASRKKKAYDLQQLDLFAEEDNNPPIDEQTEPIKTNDNGSTEVRNDGQRESSSPQGRTAGQPADQNGTLGGGKQQTDERPDTRGVGARGEQHRVHDGERGLGTTGQRTEHVEAPIAEGERKNTRNFHYDSSDPAPTRNQARYEANLAAIRLLKQLQDEDRQATPEEQRVLAKFTGWGGLGEFFKGEPGTTYYASYGEKSPYQVIKELLTDEELQAAQLSRNSAYYTPAAIIDELWSIAQHLGFKGGNILEGSAGIGNILAQIPQSISDRSNLQAVEIDTITAGILAQLYPDAQVHAAGFQEVDIPNNSQDLVITNVPFVTGLRVYDKKEKDLSKRFGNIHDFCIAKNVRKLRQGGLGIFITSSGTLDSSKDLRRWLNNEGETDVIGAFRLNRETFGGTSATSDIIVVRKRVNGQKDPRAIDVLDTDVARVAATEENGKNVEKKLIYNRYFVEHPESMGGEMGFGFEHGDTRWGGTTAGCYPSPSIDQTKRLQDWVESIPTTGEVQTITVRESNNINPGTYEEYHGELPYGSLVLNSKGEICRVYNGMVVPVEGINPTKVKGHTKAEVLTDYNALKASVEELLAEQARGISDEGLRGLLRKLNKAYDDFVKKYGYLNRNVSLSFLRNDVQWASMAALENVKETIDKSGKKKIEVSKTDVFSERVVGVMPEPKAENARDGVILSVQQYGNVRPDMIATWLGRQQEEVEKEIIESRLAFRDPQTGNIIVSHEYLSGNVREKLAYAEEHNENGIYDTNIEELRNVIPVDIPAHLIEFNIGSTWIPVELYHQYLKEKFGVEILQLTHVGSAWLSNEKSYGGYVLRNEKNSSEGVYSEVLHERIYGHQLMIAAMNNVPVVVSKVQKNYDGTTETITDKEATVACSDKISQIKDDFVEWARGKMQEDSELAERVQKIYNERFNAIVPMLSVDKAFLSVHLPGQNHQYELYNHQQQAVVRATTQPVMLAHEVGTGKTITLISAAMEMRRLGTAKKPMIVVQNATTPQFVKEAKDLYPNAKILTVSERDRTKEGRQEFYAKIKYNDWDLIIVPQSVFDMIPDSESRTRDFIQEKIEEKLHAIEAAKEANVDAKVTKRMEKELKALQEDLQNANMSGKRSKSKSTEKDAKKEAERIANATAKAEEMLDRRTDEVEDFDDMGIDALLIDEAHNYKHLGFATMMARGVKGIDPSYSKRAAALYLKCQSVYERQGHRNVVFATGTPISNTAAEIWTFMKYLMPKEVLKDNDIYYFDDFVHNFGKINEQLEFATNGKFKANNRFAQYGNVPELMRIWLTCADCVLTREVGQVNDKVPEMEGGKAQDIFLPQSPSLIDIMASVRAELERYEKMSGKEKKENSHIPLTMYGVAKRAAIDPRLVDANAADEPLSKTNKAVEETLRSLKETKKYNGTVAIFCDSYRNQQTGFNLFEDIKAKLVKGGVSAAKIAIIRSEMTDAAKQKIFDAVREGEIRVIMGSTQTLGTGVNIQTRLHTLIHMDAPDRPMDYTQRNGRIIRQGNMHRQWNIPVRVLRFGVEDSLDVTSYQRLKTKAGFIDSIMNGKGMIDNNLENRVLEDVEEGIFDNPVAMLSGSQYALLKSQAERDLRKWSARQQQHNIDQILIADKLKKNARIMEYRRQLIADDERFLEQLRQTLPDGKVTEYNINGTVCHTAAELKEALKAVNADIQARADQLRKNGYEGEKREIQLALSFNGMPFNVGVVLTYKSSWEGGMRKITIDKGVQFTTPISDMWLNSPTKVLDKLIEHIEQDYLSGTQASSEINYSRSYIERLQQENELMRQREGKPFAHQEELEKARALVDEYTQLMQEELQEKEAKYANMASDRKVTLNEQEDEEETTPEAQFDELDYTPGNMTEAQQLATSAVIEALNDNTDLDVIEATEEDVEAQKKSLSETATWSELMLRTNYAADISSNDGAKILQKIETTKQKLENSSNLTIKDPISVLSHAIGLQKTGLSYYGTFKTINSSTITLRISNHNATVSNFDNEKEQDGISIVITPQRSKGISNDGTAHIIEFYYRKNDFAHYYGHPYADILGSIKTLLETGEYTDTTGLAIREEVNIPDMMLTPNGRLYGWAVGNKIYLTKDGMNPNTPIHEYTHLWAKAMQRNNPEGWQSIVDIFKDTPLWQEVKDDPNYSNMTTDDAICSEVLSRYSGQRGAARMEEWATEELYQAEQSDDLLRGAKVRRLISRAKKAIEDFWHWVGTNLFGIKHFDSAEQVADRVLFDLLNQTELGDLSGNTNAEMMISGYTTEKAKMINDWYNVHPRPQYQRGETLDHYKARLDAWQAERDKFQAQLKEGRPSVREIEQQASQQQQLHEENPIINPAPEVVHGVRPTMEKGESLHDFARRLQAYRQMQRDDKLVAEYTAEINRQASKKKTLERQWFDAAKIIEDFQDWMVERGATITDESNTYWDTFLAPGRVSDAYEKVDKRIMKPLTKHIAKIIAPKGKLSHKKSRLEGLNLVWHNMDMEGTGKKIDGKALTPEEIIGVYCQAKDCAEAAELGLPDRGAKGFVDSLATTHEDIIRAVENVIPKEELDKLWELVRKATHYALEYQYESGGITKETYEEYSRRQFYVPQRGSRQRDLSGRMTQFEPVGKRYKDPFNAALIAAHGRQTLASDPFSYIMSIEASSIVSSENNKIKQKFLRFCLDNEDLGLKTGAFRIRQYWLMNEIDHATGKVKTDKHGNPIVNVSYSAPTSEDIAHDNELKTKIRQKRKEWAKVNRAYLERKNHDELSDVMEAAYQHKLQRIEQDIDELESQMRVAWHAINGRRSMFLTKDEEEQKIITVMLDGKRYELEVEDEKLGNAINKKFKQHQDMMFDVSNTLRQLTRFMSASLTQYNPEFALSNAVRDYQIAIATLAVEHPELLGAFMKNYVLCQQAVWNYAYNDKVFQHFEAEGWITKKTLARRDRIASTEMGQYLDEYFASGAATGYSFMKDLDVLRNDFSAMVNEGNIRKGARGAIGAFSMLTEVSETAVRFAAYVSARKAGWGVNAAAMMSKELTTNFDRGGEMADSSWLSWFSFFRAQINGNLKFQRAFKRHAIGYSIVAACYFALGMLNQWLNPDDPDDEIWASDYTRQSNFVIWKLRIPTGHFMRIFFSAGVNAMKWIQGDQSYGQAIYNSATFAMDELLPAYTNPFSNGTQWNSALGRSEFDAKGFVQGFVPTPLSPIADVVLFNRDFKGAHINYEPWPWEKNKKDILLANGNTLPIYKKAVEGAYTGVGGNLSTKYKGADPAWRSLLFDISPSSVEHIVEGYMPGGMDMMITTVEAIYDVATGTHTSPDKWPIVRKFWNKYTPEMAYRQQYYRLNAVISEYERELKDYKANDHTEYNNMLKSNKYKVYLATKNLVGKNNKKENPTTADVKALIEANRQWIK